MRAHEFVREKISPETTQTGFKDQRDIANGLYRLVATGHNTVYRDRPVNMLKVDLFDNELERNIAWVEFIVQTREQDQEPHLVSTSTYVRPEYRNQGLAKIMYQYANSIGNDIEPSRLQTQAGKNMWKGLTKSVKQLPPLPEPPPPPPKPTVWQRLRGAVGAKSKEFVEEARSHPDLNRKFDSGRHELYRWVADHNIGLRAMWGISMTMLPKLGINPQKGASDDTPKGIYFYPLWYIWPWVNGGEELPWGNDFPYIQLFQYDNSRQMTQQSKVDPAQLKQALRQYCPEEIIENTEYNNDPYWFIYDCLVQLGQSDETTIVRWNKVLRDLGFTSVMDEGKGWIATNEPVQGIILDPRIIKQVKTFENYNRKQPINESIDADQVLQYVKRAHAPDEFDIEYSITDHPEWELKSIPLSKLKLDPEGEQRDPYNRVNWVDYDKVQDLIPQITSVLKTMPIVVDSQGWIIDGNHRATAAAEAGLKSVPAYVPTEVNENFADGKVKGKSRPGRVKRAGASCAGSVTDLRAKAKKYGGERGKMYHWCANMKGGKKK